VHVLNCKKAFQFLIADVSHKKVKKVKRNENNKTRKKRKELKRKA
jgi:hypothetical protein